MATIRKKTLNVARLKAIFDGTAADAQEAAKEAGELVLERAIPLTPMKSGALRESGRVSVEGTAKNIQVKVIFGDNRDVDYAAVVHEDMEPKTFTVEGTGPKYLETAVNSSIEEIETLIGNTINNSLRNRVRE